MQEIDLCRIFSNVLNNALEASDKIEKTHRQIDVHSKVVNHWFTLVVENTYDGITNDTKGTTKKEYVEHGFGLSIIEETVVQYHGLLKIARQANRFIVSIHIPLGDNI